LLQNHLYGFTQTPELPEDVALMVNAIQDLIDGATIFDTADLDEQITTTLPPCLQNLVTDLQGLQNGEFGQIIAQFAGNNPVPLNYNWNIVTGTLAVNQPAITSPGLAAG